MYAEYTHLVSINSKAYHFWYEILEHLQSGGVISARDENGFSCWIDGYSVCGTDEVVNKTYFDPDEDSDDEWDTASCAKDLIPMMEVYKYFVIGMGVSSNREVSAEMERFCTELVRKREILEKRRDPEYLKKERAEILKKERAAAIAKIVKPTFPRSKPIYAEENENKTVVIGFNPISQIKTRSSCR
jgi:hypothetical protein